VKVELDERLRLMGGPEGVYVGIEDVGCELSDVKLIHCRRKGMSLSLQLLAEHLAVLAVLHTTGELHLAWEASEAGVCAHTPERSSSNNTVSSR
jgi:hypothetical protein